MTGEPLGRRTYISVYDEFRQWVKERSGIAAPSVGDEVEKAMLEFINEDELFRLEQALTPLFRAGGHPRGSSGEKKGRDRLPDGADTRPVRAHVSPAVDEAFEAFVAKHGMEYRDALAVALREYMEGGRLAFLIDRVERLSSEVAEEIENRDPSEGGPTAEEKKRRWLAKQFIDESGNPGQFTREDFGEALNTMPYRGDNTEHMREKYLPLVLDRLECTEHPNNPDLFVPKKRAEEIAEKEGIDSNAPAIDRKPYNALSDKERIRGLRIELARRAAERSTRKRALRVETAREDVFDGTPGVRKTKNLMNRAAQADGFETDSKGGQKRLRCDLEAVTDDLLADAGLTVMDAEDNDESRRETEREAEETFAQLDAAEVVDDQASGATTF